MNCKRLRLTAAALLVLLSRRAGAQELFPLAELRPGLMGTAYTVLQGDSIMAFDVEILDRLPGRGPFDLVLVRGARSIAEAGGISQGMSGSPVYVQGRWLGAIAYNFSFTTEPLALLTPAEAMLELADHGRKRAEGGGAIPDLRSLFDPGAKAAPAHLGGAFSDAPLTLALGGLDPLAMASLEDLLGDGSLRFVPMGQAAAGEAAPRGRGETPDPAPGSAVAVELLRGPVSLAAIGTLTHREGDRVWAFGHPFLDEGAVELPLSTAWIHGVVPSIMNSSKIASLGEPIGTVLVDGRAGLFGRLGPQPSMLPLRLALVGEGGKISRAEFQIARHRRLLPLIARVALQGWLQGPLALQEEGELSLRLELNADPKLREPVLSLSENFAGEGAAEAAGAWLQGLLGALESLPEGPVPLDSLRLELSWRPGGEPLELVGLAVDRPALRPGESWQLRTRFSEKGRIIDRADWRFPQAGKGEGARQGLLPGDYQLHLADAQSFHVWNMQRQPELYRFRSAGPLLGFLAGLEPAGSWVLWIEAPGSLPVLESREMDLPVYFRQLMPREARGDDKNARRLVYREEILLPEAGEARGHLSVPVSVLPYPVRSEHP